MPSQGHCTQANTATVRAIRGIAMQRQQGRTNAILGKYRSTLFKKVSGSGQRAQMRERSSPLALRHAPCSHIASRNSIFSKGNRKQRQGVVRFRDLGTIDNHISAAKVPGADGCRCLKAKQLTSSFGPACPVPLQACGEEEGKGSGGKGYSRCSAKFMGSSSTCVL